MIKEFCSLVGWERILVFNLKLCVLNWRKKTLVYPEISWSFILNDCYLEKPPGLKGPLVCLNKFSHGWAWLDTSNQALSAYMLRLFGGYHYVKKFWTKYLKYLHSKTEGFNVLHSRILLAKSKNNVSWKLKELHFKPMLGSLYQ